MQVHAVNVAAELQTANVACFQRKVQLSGFSAYLDGSPSQLIQIHTIVLYLIFFSLTFVEFLPCTLNMCSI